MHRLGGIAAIVSFLYWAPAGADAPTYAVTFGARFEPGNASADAYIEVRQPVQRLQQVRMRAPGARYRDFAADGVLRHDNGRVIWNPPADGGRLSYRVFIDKRRNEKGFDAMVAEDFALLRGEDLFPPAAISQMDGAESVSRLGHRALEQGSAAAVERMPHSRIGTCPLKPTVGKRKLPQHW